MLNKTQATEIKSFLSKYDVPKQDHDFILSEIEYDLWEFKGRETHTQQCKSLKRIEKVALNLLEEVKNISWELSSELHDDLGFYYSSSHSDDEDFDDIDNLEWLSPFEKAVLDQSDADTLQTAHDEEVEEAFSHVPIDGRANIHQYLNNLISACQSLTERKSEKKDSSLYSSLQFRWDSLCEKYGVTVNKANSIEFIGYCLSKDTETVKKQYRRLGIESRDIVLAGAERVSNLELRIFNENRDKLKIFKGDSSVLKFNAFEWHWLLTEAYQKSQKDSETFEQFLETILKNGIEGHITSFDINLSHTQPP
ncbi:hypothetical protein [Salinivibrio sp. VYel1]|uniref:hypothetical protein n=1 Tax=Salinivibrio sp. VYel1 TaxID=2490490 RepID=UPI00128B792E|nr:hypothetical protein [Salinivibrio sp. VYel1]MPX91447.1 hypothetical protein [Salinivibrio sp. VYel1]